MAEYDRLKPTLKEFLLRSAGAAGIDDDAPLRESFRRLRATGAAGVDPRSREWLVERGCDPSGSAGR